MKFAFTLLLLLGSIVLLSGCVVDIAGVKVDIPIGGEAVTTTLPELVCNLPYIRVGSECCLDQNGNRVCDKDEVVVTTTQPAPTTTVTVTIVTATTVTTVTTLPAAACSSNADCGEPTETIKCSGDNVIKVKVTYKCTNPGKPTAQCIGTSSTQVVETCDAGQVCYMGVCVNSDDAGSTTTLAAGSTTTTVAGGSTTTTTFGVGPMGDASTTTTTHAPSTTIKCSSIFHPTGQRSCDKGSCGRGFTCVYDGLSIIKKCVCTMVIAGKTTTTTPPLHMLCSSAMPGACGLGTCPAGKHCATVYSSGWVPVPIDCECQPVPTTTSTTLLPCQSFYNPITHTTTCIGSCSGALSCVKAGMVCKCFMLGI